MQTDCNETCKHKLLLWISVDLLMCQVLHSNAPLTRTIRKGSPRSQRVYESSMIQQASVTIKGAINYFLFSSFFGGSETTDYGSNERNPSCHNERWINILCSCVVKSISVLWWCAWLINIALYRGGPKVDITVLCCSGIMCILSVLILNKLLTVATSGFFPQSLRAHPDYTEIV